VGESSFWYRPTRVVPDQRPLNGRRRRLSRYLFNTALPDTAISIQKAFGIQKEITK